MSAPRSSAQFTNINAGLPGAVYSSAAWGDFDNDGYLDILLTGTTNAGSTGAISQIWHNLGNGTFTNINAGLPGVEHGSVAVADFYDNGYLDILLTGTTNGGPTGAISQIWHNLGNGTFTNINAGLPGVDFSSVACGDFNNDGKTDILLGGLTTSNTYTLQVWLNLGNGKFTNINIGLPGLYACSAALADFDNDGYLDMLFTGFNGTNYLSQVWRNLGNGTFSNINIGMPGMYNGSAAWGDFDNAGRLDILLRGNTNSVDQNAYISQVWRNLGNGIFTNVANAGLPGGNGPGAEGSAGPYGTAAWGDFDNDGFLDVLLMGPTNIAPISQVWRNLANSTFTNINAGLPGVWFGCALWGDYNNDGLLDILLIGTTSSANSGDYTAVYQNFSPTTNTPPTAPSNLNAVQTGKGVVLSWSAASDAQTPTTGLSYNVRVGTTPGGCDILSPMADPVTGFRRVPQLGNAQERLFSYLTNLTFGTTYYWSVQAIDTAWAGGPFAPETSFTIIPVPPTVITVAASNITSTSAKVAAQASPNLSPSALWFQYGATTNYGNVTSVTNIGSGTNTLTVTNFISGLAGGVVYHCQAVASNSLGTTYGNDITFSTPLFTLISVGTKVSYGYVAWGDFDNDGYLDILLTGTTNLGDGSLSQIWRNAGNGIFTNINSDLPGVSESSVAWGDFNNDGFLDILLPSQVWQNLGNGTFSNINVGLPGGPDVAWGDFNNDGLLDIFDASQIWQNQGGGAFTNINAGFLSSTSVALGDYDNDGRLDILLSDISQLQRNLGKGTFTNINPGLPLIGLGSIAWGDFDNDGYLDILLTGSTNGFTSGTVTQIWRNLGNGAFTNINAGLPGVWEGTAVWGDYDNDGYLDILLTGVTNGPTNGLTTQIWRNLGNGTFTNINASLPGVFGSAVAWGDYDNDGRLDIILTGATNIFVSGNICQILHNFTLNSNTPPTAPTNLNATVYGTGVVLNWGAATDAQTPTKGLYYNVRVGTTPGGFNVMSPMADPATGFRRVPQIGNAQERLFSYLTNLTIGTTYYWSVQAIDTAWAGGPFATEASFTITTPSPPVIMHPAYATGSGNFGFDISGTSGFEVTVQSSSNLINWVPIWSSTLGSGLLHFTDTNAGTSSNHFYRALIP